MHSRNRNPAPHNGGRDDWRAFALVSAGAVLLIALAFGLGALLNTPPLERFSLSWRAIVIGIGATAPMIILLDLFMRTKHRGLARFRESQIEFFRTIGFRFTPARIALLAIGAGVSEELLFRGVLQTWIEGGMPLAWAIVLPNILFGALHARTALYAVIAGLVGVYMGVLFAISGNLLAPIIAHGLYDWIALIYTQRAIAARGTVAPSGSE